MLWTSVISDLKGEEIVQTCYKERIAKNKSKSYRVEKIMQRKGDKLYLKWKGTIAF